MNETTRLERNRKKFLILIVLALILGVASGVLYGRHTAAGSLQNKSSSPMHEIIVSKDQGLLFKSEDGTPLLSIGKDSFGTHLRLLSSDGTPLLELNNLQGAGGIAVNSKTGGRAYVSAAEDSATLTLIGKYNKEAVRITSATLDGGGSLSINEGKQGYEAVQIGGGPNKMNSKGTITVSGDNGPVWQAP